MVKAKIAAFAKVHGFRLIFYKPGLCTPKYEWRVHYYGVGLLGINESGNQKGNLSYLAGTKKRSESQEEGARAVGRQ
jgi:hypothetical protein